MSSGPEHYREAERLLALAEQWESTVVDDTDSYSSIDAAHRAAQVHATLALAAATADDAVTRWLGDENTSGSDWSRVTA